VAQAAVLPVCLAAEAWCQAGAATRQDPTQVHEMGPCSIRSQMPAAGLRPGFEAQLCRRMGKQTERSTGPLGKGKHSSHEAGPSSQVFAEKGKLHGKVLATMQGIQCTVAAGGACSMVHMCRGKYVERIAVSAQARMHALLTCPAHMLYASCFPCNYRALCGLHKCQHISSAA
jgi:hypothetical protein